MRTWHISAVSGLACEQKKDNKKRQKQKEKKRNGSKETKKNCLVVCLLVFFSQMDGFFSLFTLLQVNYADMVHA